MGQHRNGCFGVLEFPAESHRRNLDVVEAAQNYTARRLITEPVLHVLPREGGRFRRRCSRVVLNEIGLDAIWPAYGMASR